MVGLGNVIIHKDLEDYQNTVGFNWMRILFYMLSCYAKVVMCCPSSNMQISLCTCLSLRFCHWNAYM